MRERQRASDLVCLAADGNIEKTLGALLRRHQALDIRQATYHIVVHPERDPGCRIDAPSFLRPFLDRYDHALVVFDREGCGKDESREKLEEDVESRLGIDGWQDRAVAVVIEPELEAWVWNPSPHVDAALGWAGRSPDLRSWLEDEGYLDGQATKPGRPKEAVEKALWTVRKPRSSSIYKKIAEQVSVARCIDPAFTKLKTTLANWFPTP